MNTIFRPEWKRAISSLEPLDRLAVYEAIIDYSDTGEIPTLGIAASIAFEFMRSTIDADRETYNAICKRNRSNGSKGGRPRNTQNPEKPRETQNNPENPVGILETQENPEKEKKEAKNKKKTEIQETISDDIAKKIDLDAEVATVVAPARKRASVFVPDLGFVSEELRDTFAGWLKYKTSELKDGYKTQGAVRSCYSHLMNLASGDYGTAKKIIEQSIANHWKGLFELKQSQQTRRPSVMRDKQIPDDIWK